MNNVNLLSKFSFLLYICILEKLPLQCQNINQFFYHRRKFVFRVCLNSFFLSCRILYEIFLLLLQYFPLYIIVYRIIFCFSFLFLLFLYFCVCRISCIVVIDRVSGSFGKLHRGIPFPFLYLFD